MLALALPLQGAFAKTSTASLPAQQRPTINSSVNNSVSPPLRSIEPAQPIHQITGARPLRPVPHTPTGGGTSAVQSQVPTTHMPATSLNFDGVGNGFTGPQGTFTVNSAPSDSNGAIGSNYFVEIVNTDFAVFNKTTDAPVYGPVPINTLWTGFGGGCETNNDGDPTVVYDHIANRWVISQFSVSTTPYLQCVAVSTTSDPTGSYYQYSFQYNDFPDYPKMGVWPDAYYTTFNMFAGGTNFSGGWVCAYDRASMLTGAAATQQCFNVGTSYGGLLPSDVDGSTLPPAGSPNFVISLGAVDGQLALWKFHVDWTNTANTTLTGPTILNTAAFTLPCGDTGGTCVPQSGTSQQLDTLGDRLMYRLTYRNFGDHESLVVNHTVTAGSSTGVRWYEIRSPGTTPTIYQQGTYAPDASYRWMGSIAMDQAGDMAMGYSVSSSTLHPQIRYTGRLAGDTLGQMTQGESTIINGAGSQTGSSLSRWGDYSSISIDPTDDCTFWYTDQYIPSNGAFNWKTRIASFKFPNCGGMPPPNDFSISASPSSVSVAQGNSGTSAISTAVTSGSAQTVNLTASVSPSGPTASLNPSSVTAGGSSTLTITVGSSVAPGAYTITVTGTEGSATHSTSVTVNVTAPATNDFSISASPTSLSIPQGSSGPSTISTAVVSGSAESITLSASGQPAGVNVSFNPSSVTAGGSSTMTVTVGSNTPTGTYTITVTGTAPSATHSTTVSLTVTADFSISANPTSVTVTQGSSGTSTISTAVTSGSAQTVSLSASGLPSGATASFNPSSVTAGSSSTLTITTSSSTPTGTSTITITGTGTSATHTTTVSLTVNPSGGGGGIVNGGFETGNFTGWATTGTTAISTNSHTGTYAAQVGGTSPTNGDSSIKQTFTASSGSTSISFWYQVHCPDTLTYDWATATLKDNTANTTTTVLAKTCTNSGSWVQVTASGVTAGHSYTLTLISHDDNYPGDPTYTLYDDVVVKTTGPPPPPDFSISASPSTVSAVEGGSATSTISTGVIGSAGTVNLSVSGAPSGATAGLSPTSVTAGNSSTLTINTGTATPGTYTLTVTGTEGSTTHSATVTLNVDDFSINANPTSLSLGQGTSGTSTISTTANGGSAGPVSLSASVSPSSQGVTASLNPTSVTAGNSSTLTVSATSCATTGPYTVTVTGTEGSATHSTTVSVTLTAPPADFTISANPIGVTVTQGSSGTSTISTALIGCSAQNVTLSASGLPSGATAGFNPNPISSNGGSSTLTLTTSSTTPTGTYSVTVTGTGSSGPTHTTSVSLTVNSSGGGNAIVNGGFETGNFTGWTTTGTTAISTNSHTGTYAARVGGTSPTNGDSSIKQTFTAPAGSSTISFWYKVVCPDTLTYDWATATLKDNTTTTTTTVLAKTCTNNNTWVKKSPSVTAGHSYTLTLISHDDNYPGDPTYTLYDDVSAPGAAPEPSNPLVNGGFEAGNLSGWTSSGTTGISATSHSGNFSAMVGSTLPTNGDSSISQTFTVPTASTTLSFWYQVHCSDTISHDWATSTLRDTTTGTVTTVLAKTCTNTGSWVEATANVRAGHSYTLTLINRDDNHSGDATYTLFDDVTTPN
jgi:uncharacterized membrane protein